MGIEYEIEFINPEYQELYGRRKGGISGPKLKEPYVEVRRILAHWIRDQQNAVGRHGSGGAVPKFRFLHLVVDGKQLAGLGNPDEPVWCLHCEQVGPVRLDIEGDRECSYCGAGEFNLRDWAGGYEPDKVYVMYSDEFMRGRGMGDDE